MLSLLRGGVVVVAVAVVCGTAGAAAPTKVHVGVSASFALSGGGALWVTDRLDNKLIRVDPAAGRVKWRLGIPSSPFGLAYGAGSVWVGSRNGGRVTRVNPVDEEGAASGSRSAPLPTRWPSAPARSGSRTRAREPSAGSRRSATGWSKTIRVGGGPNGIAVAFGKVWVADYGASHLIRIDPLRNRVEKRISIPKADWISASADALWVSSETGKLYQVDPASMAVEANRDGRREPARDGLGRRQALGAEHRRQHRLGGRSGDELGGRARMPVGQSPLAVASAAGHAWVTSDFDGDLWRFDP